MGVNPSARFGLDRVDNVPLLLLPLITVFWTLWGVFLCLWHPLLHITCRVRFEGTEHLGRNYIFCGWHDMLVPYTVALWRVPRPYALLSHHAWFVRPIHWLSHRMGVDELIPIMENQDGRAAAHRLVDLLKLGYSTTITPDGPSGPRRELKRGVLVIAAKSGVPILPVRIEACSGWVWRTNWDHKTIPWPFSRIVVRYLEPIVVARDDIKAAEAALRAALT